MGRRKKAERGESSSNGSLVINNCKILTPQGVQDNSILIENGVIKKIGRGVAEKASISLNAKGLLALPGLIDVHVHLRGLRLSYKEDFTSGTAAAAAGGFTSVLDMPNTRPVTDSPIRLREKIRDAERKILVNVGFHVAAVKEFEGIQKMKAQGAFSLKLYMPNPISQFEVERDEMILGLFKAAAEQELTISVHAEEGALLGDSSQAKSYLELARTHPPEAEAAAVRRILSLQKLANCSVHFAHLTLPSSLDQVQKSLSASVSSEVTPHHLLLSEKELKRSGSKAWMVPPLRSNRTRQSLLELVARGMASVVASDHAPHSLAEKRSRVTAAPPGVPGLETTLRLLLTLVDKGVISIRRVAQLLCSNPARLFNLPSKGKLARGMDGDLVLVDLKKRGRIKAENFFSKAKYSPFEGLETRGGVVTTIVAGNIVYENGEIVNSPGIGKVLKRAR